MGWKKTKIGEFLFERKGLLDPNDRALFSFKKIEKIDFSEGKIFLSDYSPTKTKQIIVKKRDFVFSGLNIEKGAVAINDFDQELVVSANYSTCEVDYLKVDQNFLKFLIKSQFFKNLLKENLKKDYGFTRPKHLMNLEIYLPSLEEQKQVAEKLKLNEEKQKNLQLQVNQQKTNLKNLRKQILQDAIEGKLTKEWREKNPDIEPASELLKKIKKEKEKLISEKKIKKEKPLPEINKSEIPFELPESWVWTRLGEVMSFIYGSSLTKDKTKNNGKYPVYGSNGITGYYNEFLTDKKSIIVGRKGSAGALNVSYNPSWTTDVAYYVEEREGIDFAFMFFLLKSLKLEDLGKGIKPGLNRNEAYFLIISLPPLPEQLAIVSKLQTLMQKLDEVEKQIEKNLTFSKQLSKVILAEAFNQNNLEKK